MDQELSVNNTPWAKLIAVQADNQNLILYPNKNDCLFDGKLRIYKNQDGYIFIKNRSASRLLIDDNQLKINQEKQLFGGETLSLVEQNKNYTFCLVNSQTGLKRNRDEAIESQSLQKLVKVENDLQRELTCSICTYFLYKCMILTPCLHSFCSFCLFDQLKSSSICPLCRTEAVSVGKNSVLSNLVQLAADNFPTLQKSQDRKEYEQINIGGVILRNSHGVYVGSLVNWKKDGQGKLIYKDGRIYEGGWKNDKREGKGLFIYSNGNKYDGYWMNDCKHGAGKYIWSSGDEYEGDFQDSSRHGHGIMKYKDGSVYKGDWENGKKEGKGILTFLNGDRYEGKWLNGIPQPEVKVEYANGDRYEGEIDINSLKKQGKGILVLANGHKYKGSWVDNILQPKATIEYPNGDQYEGEINVESLQKNGKGVFTFKNGGKYDGYWMNDKQHGRGKEIYQGGKRIFEGVWKEGRISGEAIMTDIDGVRYQVDLKRLEVGSEKDALSENTEIDDSKTQDSDHVDLSENE